MVRREVRDCRAAAEVLQTLVAEGAICRQMALTADGACRDNMLVVCFDGGREG